MEIGPPEPPPRCSIARNVLDAMTAEVEDRTMRIEDVEALFVERCSPGERRRASIASSPSAAREDTVAWIDALRDHGVLNFALSTLPAPVR